MSRKEPIRRVVRKSGEVRYVLVLDVGTWPDGTRRQEQSTHRTLKEARQALAQKRVDLEQGTYVVRNDLTVKDYLLGWLDGREGIRESTKGGYKSDLKPVITRYGTMPLQRLTPGHIVTLKNEMKAADASPRSINVMLTILSMALTAAKRQGLVTVNAASSDLVERVSEAKKVVRQTWTPAQVTTFLDHVKDDRYAAAWGLTFCGMRRSEVLGLTWDAVDFDKGTIVIRQARTVNKGKGDPTVIGDPKTSNGYRTIPVPESVLAQLRAFKRQQQIERLALGSPLKETDLVVVDEAAVPVYPDTYSDMFWEHSKAAGLPVIRLHDARHTAATLLHTLYGLPPAVAASYLGHDTAVYLATYVHGEAAHDQVKDALARMQAGTA